MTLRRSAGPFAAMYFVAAFLFAPTAHAQAVRMTTVAAYASDVYPAPCQDRPVMVDLWVLNGTTYEFHDRCYANIASDPNPGTAVCFFKHPMPVGTPASAFFARFWKIDSTCTTYLDAIAPADPNSYVDVHPDVPVQPDEAFDAYPDRLVQLATATWAAAIDRNGGALYEFRNLRASDTTLVPGDPESAVHAHYGAAVQTAVHSGALNSLTTQPCLRSGGQGYWNPTQAGAMCTVRNASDTVAGDDTSVMPGTGGLSVLCDGVANDTCTLASATVEHTRHQMLNWDYGPPYFGPYAAGDTSFLHQLATARPDYLQVDASLLNTGPTRTADVTVIEAPTFYFTDRYRRYFVPDPGGAVTSVDIPVNFSGLDANNFNRTVEQDLPWVCFENRGIGSVNNFITLGLMLDAPFRARVTRYLYAISEGAVYDSIKFTFAPFVEYPSGEPLSFRYVVFPYRYDETVTTEFGTLTVADTIAAMRNAYTVVDGGVGADAATDAATDAGPDDVVDAAALGRDVAVVDAIDSGGSGDSGMDSGADSARSDAGVVTGDAGIPRGVGGCGCSLAPRHDARAAALALVGLAAAATGGRRRRRGG